MKLDVVAANPKWKGIYAQRRLSSIALQLTRHKTLCWEGL
jgi:hypothetical protein